MEVPLPVTSVFDTIVLIPSLHPNHLLTEYAEALIREGFLHIVIVDDGSGPDEKYQSIFRQLDSLAQCVVIGYPGNRGKGYALKHGLRYIAEQFPEAPGVVTADSDGQHTAPDLIKVASGLKDKPRSLMLGSRNFNQINVPRKSRWGNRLTAFFFLLLYGQWLPDTQTGLRAFSSELIPFMLKVPGDRFEYEMNMLIYCSGEKIPFEVIPIDTIYLQENKSSHFRALHDSARIYKQLFGNFFKYASSSLLSFLLDIALFTLLDRWLLGAIFGDLLRGADAGGYLHTYAAAGIARVASSLFNFMVNKRFVFQAKQVNGAVVRYALLAVFSLSVSALLTNLLFNALRINKSVIKALLDTVLYFFNYRVQKAWVFKLRKAQN